MEEKKAEGDILIEKETPTFVCPNLKPFPKDIQDIIKSLFDN